MTIRTRPADPSVIDEFENGPGLWNKLASRFSEYLPDGYKPVVAGGAVRDFLLGLPPKDIDVFIVNHDQEKTASVPSLMLEVAILNFFEEIRTSSKKSKIAEDDSGIFNLSSGPSALGSFFGEEIRKNTITKYPIQVIIGEDDRPAADVPSLIDRFDYGLVKAAYFPEAPVFIVDSLFDKMENNPSKMTGTSKLSTASKLRAEIRYREFKKRTGFNSKPPSDWFSTENFVLKQLPDTTGYSDVEYAIEYKQRGYSDRTSFTDFSNTRFLYWDRRGSAGDIMEYRFVDIGLAS